MWPWALGIFRSKTTGYAVAIIAVFGAGLLTGWNWKSAKVVRAENRELRQAAAETIERLREANRLEIEGRDAIERIENVRIPSSSDCRLDDTGRVQFNEAIAEFNRYSATELPDRVRAVEENGRD